MVRPANRNTSLYFDYPHFPFITAPEQKGRARRYPVVVVGAGPVGLTAALELARHGVPSVVIDDKDTVNDGSRAICIARHSLEIMQQLGLADRFTGKGLGWIHGTSFYREQPVFRLQMPHSDDERFMPMYNLQQQYIERFLVDAAMAEPLIDLRWQTRLTGVRQDKSGVMLTMDTPVGEYGLVADYVLAADGARSAVRHALGLQLRGEAYEGRYVIVDIQMRSDHPTERRAFFDPPVNPGSTVLVHKQPDNIWRIDYQLLDGEDADEALKEDNIRARIGAILGMLAEKGRWELEWWSLYKAHTLALDDYRCGRCLFIGDAAHLVPIFGVRGLNSGFADAVNAAWKLSYVVHGWAEDVLLDSYTPERRGATLDVFANASRSTRFMTPVTRGDRLLRDAALSLALRNDFAKPLLNPRQSQPYTYRASPLTSFLARDGVFAKGPPAGAPLVNQRVASDDFLLDHLGQGFSGLYFSDDGTVADDLVTVTKTLRAGSENCTLLIVSRRQTTAGEHIRLCDRDGHIFDTYGSVHGSFYLVRPDRHICARWRQVVPREVRNAFGIAIGATQ